MSETKTEAMSDSSPQQVTGLLDHLFRHQAGQMIATLVRIFGPARIDLAEEVVQEAVMRALEQWPYRGVPQNPVAWLIEVAKTSKYLDILRALDKTLVRVPERGRLTCANSVDWDDDPTIYQACTIAHGHILRVLGGCWIGLGPAGGQTLALGTAALCRLGYEHDYRVIHVWNQSSRLVMGRGA